jgi:xylulokinase
MFVGIDIGTSAVKAIVIDGDGRAVSSAASPLVVSHPEHGWSEQDPIQWINAAQSVLRQLKETAPAACAAMAGVGLSGQMHGATVLGESDEPLLPAILWNDTRSAREAAELDGVPIFRQLTGNIVFPGFTAPKLVWLKRNRPDVFAGIRRVLLPKDFVRLWLSGEAITDMSDASGTAWLDVGRRRWSDQLLSATDMTPEQMPQLAEGTDRAGDLRRSVAEQLGLPAGIPIAGGAGDNAASGCGVGAIEPGAGFVSLGTSGVLFSSSEAFHPSPESAVHSFCHAVPGRWHQMGVTLAAAASLDWLAGIVGVTPGELVAELGDGVSPPAGVSFLPYLSGERTPHNDAAIRGAFLGLDQAMMRRDLTKAVLEGVAFSLRDCHDALTKTGTSINRLTALGGGARSGYWMRLLATVLETPIAVPANGEHGAAFGAARLGMIASTGADPATVMAEPEIRETIDPEPNLVPVFRDAHRAWKNIYKAVKGVS